jgi:hypothetical protein
VTIADTETVPVSGNGTYTTPTGPQGIINGIGSGQGGADREVLEVDDHQSFLGLVDTPETVIAAGPTLTSAATPSGGVLGNVTLNDQGVLAGGFNPGGTLTLRLYGPGGNLVYTDHVPVRGNGSYTTSTMGDNPNGYAPTVAGTYQWVATYGGDVNNGPASDQGGTAEQAVVTQQSPPVDHGMTAKIGFWHNQNGQALIKSWNRKRPFFRPMCTRPADYQWKRYSSSSHFRAARRRTVLGCRGCLDIVTSNPVQIWCGGLSHD